MTMAQSYSWNHQTVLLDKLSIVANPSLLAVTLVNELFYLALIKVTEFCALPLSKL